LVILKIIVSELESIDFKACFDAMRRSNLPFSPTEAHAIAIGMISANLKDRDAAWVTELYADLDPNDALATESRVHLDAVYIASQAQMANDEFGMQLFLPTEHMDDFNVAMGLRDWAQGFLYGFGLGGKAQAEHLSTEGKEALRDFYEISMLDAELGDVSEEDMQSQTELEEYMRVAAMLIFEDVGSKTAAIAGPEDHELH